MKLLIVTVVENYHDKVIKLFKQANIENFSESDIDGHKNAPSTMMSSNWFASERSGAESNLFFSFTDNENIDTLFDLIEEFNKNLETNNPIKAVVVPIERSI